MALSQDEKDYLISNKIPKEKALDALTAYRQSKTSKQPAQPPVQQTEPGMAGNTPLENDKPESLTAEKGYQPVPKTLGQGALNAVTALPTTIYETGKGLATAAIHPMDTLKGIGELGTGTAGYLASAISPNLVTPEEKNAMPTAKAAYDQMISPYIEAIQGKPQKLVDKLYNNWADVALDISSALDGAGAVTKAVGEGAKIASIAKAGTKIAEVGEKVNPLVTPLKIASKMKSVDVATAKAAQDLGVGMKNKFLYKSVTDREKILGQIQEKLRGMADKVGGLKPLDQLAEKIADGFAATEKQWHDLVDTMYESARSRMKAAMPAFDFKMRSPKTRDLIDNVIAREKGAKELSDPKMVVELEKYKTAFDKQMPYEEFKAKLDKLGRDTEWNEYKIWQMSPEEKQLNSAKQDIWRTSKKEMIDWFSEKDPNFKKAYLMADSVYKAGKNEVVNKLVANMRNLVEADKDGPAMRKIIYPGMSVDEMRAIMGAAKASPEAQGAIKASIMKSIWEKSQDVYGEFQPKAFAKELKAWGQPLEEMFGKKAITDLENMKVVGKAVDAGGKGSIMLDKAKRAYFMTILHMNGPNAFFLTPTGQHWINNISTSTQAIRKVVPKPEKKQFEKTPQGYMDVIGDAINLTKGK